MSDEFKFFQMDYYPFPPTPSPPDYYLPPSLAPPVMFPTPPPSGYWPPLPPTPPPSDYFPPLPPDYLSPPPPTPRQELMFSTPPPEYLQPPPPPYTPPNVSSNTGKFFGQQESYNRGIKRGHSSGGSVSGPGVQKQDVTSNKWTHFHASSMSRSTSTVQKQKKSTQEEHEERFREVLVKLNNLKPDDIKEGTKRADAVAQSIQAHLDLSRIYASITIDNLMVAVELRDNPSLIGHPFAICSSTQVHATNDLAKAAGVKEPMSIVNAYEKCPDIVVVLGDFPKYIEVIKQMEEVLTPYDEYIEMSTDTAQLDLSEYMRSPLVKRRRMNVIDVVEEMRMKIKLKLNLDTHVGIGPSTVLSKLASRVKTPSGVHRVESNKTVIKKFLELKPMDKHCGICPRIEYILKSLELYTTDDVWEKRGSLFFVTSPRTFKRLLGICMGITVEVEKLRLWHPLPHSVSKNANMYATRDGEFLRKVCADVCTQMEIELATLGVGGLMVIVGVKTVENVFLKRGYQLNKHVNAALSLFKMVSKFLNKYVIQAPNTSVIQLRLDVMQLSRTELTLLPPPPPSAPSFLSPGPQTMQMIHMYARLSAAVDQPTDFTSDSLVSNRSISNRDYNQETGHGYLQQNAPPKPITFTCPNCKLRIKRDVARNGEAIMARHADFCLMTNFPQLLGEF